jgi:hypothetical protein
MPSQRDNSNASELLLSSTLRSSTQIDMEDTLRVKGRVRPPRISEVYSARKNGHHLALQSQARNPAPQNTLLDIVHCPLSDLKVSSYA